MIFGVELPSIRKLRLPPKTVKDELPPLSDVLRVIIGSSVELPCLLSVWCGGMRISEVRGLKFCDIYEENNNRYIRVRRARVCINGHDIIENRNKTEQSTRDVPIPDYIYTLIQQVPHESDDDFIINENYGALKRRYDRLLKKHDLKMTFHDLRAQFATTYEMEVDKLGRVQIPTALLKKFNISRNVTVLGMGDHIEIWDSAKYEAYEQDAIENFDKNAEEL